MINIKKAEEEFKKYTDKYDKNNYKINLKINHTYRVEKNSKIIAESLNLDEENVLLATLIGLLHDIGRFEQIRKYNSYSDSKTEDHASLGVKVLKDNNFISEFAEEKYWNTIFNSVENHNKYSIDSSLNEYDTMHSKIVRDADKIDILNLYINELKKEKRKLGNCFNPKLIEDLKDKKIIKKEDRTNPGDEFLLSLAFVYDFNFKISYEIIKEKNYINILIDVMKEKCKDEKDIEYLEEIRPLLNLEIEEKINNLKE